MSLIFTLDRFEGDFGVCLADDNEMGIYQLDVDAKALASLSEGDVFAADVTEKGLENIRALPEETNRRRSAARSKLRAILEKQKNKG